MTNTELLKLLSFISDNNNFNIGKIKDSAEEEFGWQIFTHRITELENLYLIDENRDGNTFSISNLGIKKLSELKLEFEYNSEKERIEFEKSKIDLELAKKMLKEYPYTKFIAWAGLVIAIISGFLQLL